MKTKELSVIRKWRPANTPPGTYCLDVCLFKCSIRFLFILRMKMSLYMFYDSGIVITGTLKLYMSTV